jgi:hypothetical protein
VDVQKTCPFLILKETAVHCDHILQYVEASSLGSSPVIPQKSYIGDISEGVVNTPTRTKPPKQYTKINFSSRLSDTTDLDFFIHQEKQKRREFIRSRQHYKL